MPEAARAPVKPRILSPATRAALPLEDEVQSLLDQPEQAIVALCGGPGTGKSIALAHLAAVFPDASRLRLIDERDVRIGVDYKSDDVIVFVGLPLPIGLPDQRLVLAPWRRDELIEYMLARHPHRTGSVIGRVSNRDIQEFVGSPAIWQIILEEMTLDDSLCDPAAAVARNLRGRISSDQLWEQLGAACLANEAYGNAGLEDVVRLLVHASVRRIVAAERLAAQLKETRVQCRLPAVMSRALVHAVARCTGANKTAEAQLDAALQIPIEQPMAASLLYALDPSWMPPTGAQLNLSGGYLDGACWRGIRLRKAQLRQVALSGADLANAELDGAVAPGADLSGARLTGASLTRFWGAGADFTGADLSGVRGGGAGFQSATLANAKLDFARLSGAQFVGADLSRASLRRATLSQADFRDAKLERADFTGADLSEANFSNQILRDSRLTGAQLRGATLWQADLEGMQLDGIDLPGAQLSGANLTAASMQGADLSGCALREAGLADIDWEDACLRRADLRGASFHLGSSRSGLVGSPIACEGSRTGFYTDDFGEQDFKSPEEIRKANLRNVDLRGAIVDGVDFYLVDLRGAKYDLDQAKHFRRCGAILEDRCPQ
jgi:uncharacterized protein YjbI with pentapeptide repeats